MVDVKRIGMIGGTVLTAAAIGYFMQNNGASASRVGEETAAGEVSQDVVSQPIQAGVVIPTVPVQPREVALPPEIDVAQAQTNQSIILPGNDTPTLPDSSITVDQSPVSPTLPSTNVANQIVVPDVGNDGSETDVTQSRTVTPNAITPSVTAQVAQTANLALSAEDTVASTQAELVDCSVSMTATAGLAATVNLSLVAPCHAEQSVVVTHDALVITDRTDTEGKLDLTVPALTEAALFLAAFADGEGAIASTEVSSVGFYDRVALLWENGAGASLHALEFDAEYDAAGHVQSAAKQSASAAARGEAGFLAALGNTDDDVKSLAEVYSFPTGFSQKQGNIKLSVEIEITAENCGKDIGAQVLQLGADNSRSIRDLTLTVPSCDAMGDRLVVKDMVDDILLASN